MLPPKPVATVFEVLFFDLDFSNWIALLVNSKAFLFKKYIDKKFS